MDLHSCDAALSISQSALIRAGQLLQICACVITITFSLFILSQKRYRKLAVHANLKVLLFNIVVLYMACSIAVGTSCLWLQVRYLTFKEPCDLLVPIWIPIIVKSSSYVYVASFPFWHLAMTTERCWATLRPSTYENASVAYGVILSATVWAVGLWYAMEAVFLAFDDPNYYGSVFYVTMATRTNTKFLAILDYPRLAIDVTTTFVDILLVVINRRKLRRLSRNYQLKENVIATERFVLPSSVCNAVLFVAFLSVLTYLHDVRYTIPVLSYYSALEWLSLVPLVQPPISLCILVYYSRHSKRKVDIVEQSAESDLYYSQFRAMLEASATKPKTIV